MSYERIQRGGAPDQWLTYSGTLDGRRYTSLSEINTENVSGLRLRWIRQFGTSTGKIESTPVVDGGFVFTTLPPSDAVALDVKTGEVRRSYKGGVPDNLPIDTTASNRGLAVLRNAVFLGKLDCFLVAIDATDGNPLWQTKVCNPSDDYTLSGAPLRDLVNAASRNSCGMIIVAILGATLWPFDVFPSQTFQLATENDGLGFDT